MGNRFYILVGCKLGFEEMMDQTEELGSDWCLSHYGDWEDFFRSHLEIAIPILNKKMQIELIADLIKHGINKTNIQKLGISCSFFEVLDYIGVFTAKITGDKETLGKLVDLINTCEVYRVMTPELEYAKEPQDILPDYLKPCRLWDKTHQMPVWPVEIFEELLPPTEP